MEKMRSGDGRFPSTAVFVPRRSPAASSLNRAATEPVKRNRPMRRRDVPDDSPFGLPSLPFRSRMGTMGHARRAVVTNISGRRRTGRKEAVC